MSPDANHVSRIDLALPDEVRALCDELQSAGGEVRIVGGAVRDALFGAVATDWDLATSVRPEKLGELFPDSDPRERALGVVRLTAEPLQVSITSYREEDGYSDHRHPDRVTFVDDVAADAKRRDFTINAIYLDPDTGILTDPHGGAADARARRLRVIGNPSDRFAEDPLRMLRAVRFAAAHGLSPDPALLAGVTDCAALTKTLSAERVYAELTRAFTGPGRGRALRLLVDLGVADHLLPEVVPMDGVPQPPEFHPEGDVLTHVCLVLDNTLEGDPVQAWSAVLHDIGKPPTFERADRIRFHGHDQLSAQMAEGVLQRLRAPKAVTELVVEICKDHIRIASLPLMKPGKRERWMRSDRFRAHLEFHRADCLGSHGDLSIYETARQQLETLPPPPPEPLCRGSDVVALGVPEGPAVGDVLRRTQEELDSMDSPDRATALTVLKRVVQALGQGDSKGGR